MLDLIKSNDSLVSCGHRFCGVPISFVFTGNAASLWLENGGFTFRASATAQELRDAAALLTSAAAVLEAQS